MINEPSPREDRPHPLALHIQSLNTRFQPGLVHGLGLPRPGCPGLLASAPDCAALGPVVTSSADPVGLNTSNLSFASVYLHPILPCCFVSHSLG